MEQSIKSRTLTTAEQNAKAMREDFYKVAQDQQDVKGKIDKLKSVLDEQIEGVMKQLQKLASEVDSSVTLTEPTYTMDSCDIGRNRLDSSATVSSVNAATRTRARTESFNNNRGSLRASIAPSRTRTYSSLTRVEDIEND